MSLLPAGWTRADLGSLLLERMSNGRSVKNRQGGFPVLRLTALKAGTVDPEEAKEGAWSRAEAERFLIRQGDLLVARGNGSLRLVGRGGLVKGPPPEVAFPDTLIRLRVDGRLVLPEYLAYIWNADCTRAQLEPWARTTAGIYKVTQDHLAMVSLAIPPLAEQRRIVAELERRLSHLDAAAGGLDVAIRRLAVARRAVLNCLVDGSLVGADASLWRTVLVGDVCDVKGGIQKQPKRKPQNNSYPFLRVANVGRGTLDLAEVHRIELFGREIETYRLQKGDLLVVEGNGSIGHIGRAAVWDGSIENCVTQNHLIRVRAGEDVVPEFLGLTWNAPAVIAQLIRVASSTSGLHTLSTGKIKQVALQLPDRGTQIALVQEAERRLSILDAAERTISAGIAKVRQLRRSLLHAAFNGQLVPQDPNDEPAGLLLESIGAERAAAASKKPST